MLGFFYSRSFDKGFGFAEKIVRAEGCYVRAHKLANCSKCYARMNSDEDRQKLGMDGLFEMLKNVDPRRKMPPHSFGKQ